MTPSVAVVTLPDSEPDSPPKRRRHRRSGRHVYALPAAIRDALAEVFEVEPGEVDRVRLVQLSHFARLHGRWVAATTRTGTIYVAGAGVHFASDPELLLHEYFHVLRQWNTGALTAWRYLRESLRHGYRDNRYEVEARQFARQRVLAFTARLLQGSNDAA